MDTYELLYVNQTSCGLLGAPSSKVVGQKCYEMIQGRTSPCPFCTNDKLCREEFYRWEFFNPSLERTFMIRDLEINWEGHRARLELSHDTFSAEYKLAKKDQERDALLKMCIRDREESLSENGLCIISMGATWNDIYTDLNESMNKACLLYTSRCV